MRDDKLTHFSSAGAIPDNPGDVTLPGAIRRPQTLVDALLALTPEQRLDIFAEFCTECGDYDPESRCVCWRDE